MSMTFEEFKKEHGWRGDDEEDEHLMRLAWDARQAEINELEATVAHLAQSTTALLQRAEAAEAGWAKEQAKTFMYKAERAEPGILLAKLRAAEAKVKELTLQTETDEHSITHRLWIHGVEHIRTTARREAEIERDVLNGSSCAAEQAEGNSPCGACVTCLRIQITKAEQRAEAAEKERDEAIDELRNWQQGIIDSLKKALTKYEMRAAIRAPKDTKEGET